MALKTWDNSTSGQPQITWANTILCTIDDVKLEIQDLQLPLQKSSETVTPIIANKIILAKELIRQRLMNHLPDIFASTISYYGLAYNYSTYIADSGYSYAQLDTILDKIYNPYELKHCCVAKTIALALIDGALRFRAQHENNLQLLNDLINMWENEYDKRYSVALRLLRIDLNLDNIVTSDTERVRTRQIIWPA